MAVNATTGASRPGPIPPQVIRVATRITNHNHTAPLERSPADRPPSKTGVRPPALSLYRSKFEAIA